MTIPQLLALPIQGRNILLIGGPASGKSYLANLLHNDATHELICTDDAINAGYSIPAAMWSIFEDISDCNKRNRPAIVEGVLGYHLLLEGLKQDAYIPDIVIDVQISRGQQREIYLKERDPAKLKYLKKFELEHLRMMNEYHNIVPVERKPTFINFENHWEYATEQK